MTSSAISSAGSRASAAANASRCSSPPTSFRCHAQPTRRGRPRSTAGSRRSSRGRQPHTTSSATRLPST
ncbi:hypothetical protein I552_9775 [Mycobacterium xenopi 3993]|nr:hypothetical protein I552_9775 [Mycobacterium xenopi 3993]